MTKVRLSAMMFLQFFVWGAWYTSVAVFMSEHGMGDLTHWPYTVNPIAAIIAPFFLGFVADRYFSTEKVLGVLHLLGGVVMLVVPQTAASPTLFISLLLVYNLCYMPTLGLANSICFHNIETQEKQFPLIRVFGTIGWIVAGLVVSFGLSRFTTELPEKTALPMLMTGVVGIVLGLLSLTLPHTPPPAKGQKVSLRSIIGLDALKQLGSRPFYVFLVSSFLICIPLAAYYNFTQVFLKAAGFSKIAGTQTLGQMSEIVFMVLMPFFFARLGVKRMLLVGMFAWVLRYALFAAGAPGAVVWMVMAGIVLHGICYDFFFVTGQIYVDKKATPEIRGQAQGFLVLITYGVGMLIGAQIAGGLFNRLVTGTGLEALAQYQTFWIFPAVFAAAVMVVFGFLFNEKEEAKES